MSDPRPYLKHFCQHLSNPDNDYGHLKRPPRNALLYVAFPGQDLNEQSGLNKTLLANLLPGAPRVSVGRIGPGVLGLEFENIEDARISGEYLHAQRIGFAKEIAKHHPGTDWLERAEVESEGVITAVVGPLSLVDLTDEQEHEANQAGFHKLRGALGARQMKADYYEDVASTSLDRWQDDWIKYIEANFSLADKGLASEVVAGARSKWSDLVGDLMILNAADLKNEVALLNIREASNRADSEPVDLFDQEGVFNSESFPFKLAPLDSVSNNFKSTGFTVKRIGPAQRIDQFAGVLPKEGMDSFASLKKALESAGKNKTSPKDFEVRDLEEAFEDDVVLQFLESAMRDNFLSVVSGIHTLAVAENLRERSQSMFPDGPDCKPLIEVVSEALEAARQESLAKAGIERDQEESVEPGF